MKTIKFSLALEPTSAALSKAIAWFALLSIPFLLLTNGYFLGQEATADILVPINGFTCGPDLGGTWNSLTKTCRLGTPVLPTGTDMQVESGVTAIMPYGAKFRIDTGQTFHIASGGVLKIEGGGIYLNGGTLDNDGTLMVRSFRGIEGVGTIDNSGRFEVGRHIGNSYSAQSVSVGGNFTNSGVISVQSPGMYGITFGSGTFDNSGSITIQHAYGLSFSDATVITNTGTITLHESVQALFSYSHSVVNNYGTINANNPKGGNGGITVSHLNNYGTFNVNPGGILFSISTLHNYGTINVYTGGTISHTSKIVVYCGATINLLGGTVTKIFQEYGVVIYESPCHTLPPSKALSQPVFQKALGGVSRT